MEARRYVVAALAGASIVAVGAVAATALPGGGVPPVPEIVDVAAERVAGQPLPGAEKTVAFEMTPKQKVSALKARDGWEHLLAEPVVEKPVEQEPKEEPEPQPDAKKLEPQPDAKKPEPKPATKTEPKSEPKPATKTEPKAESKPATKTEPKAEPKVEPSSKLWPEGVHTHVVMCRSDGDGSVNVSWEAKLWGGTWDVVGTSGNGTGTERLNEDKVLVRFSDSGVPPSEQYDHKARVTGSVTLAQRDDPTATKIYDVEAWAYLEKCS